MTSRRDLIPHHPVRFAWVGARRGRTAALLLEVLIALTIMTAALGLLSAQLVNGLKMTQYAHEQTRVNELADRLLALMEVDLATQQQIFADEINDGDFGKQYPGYFWRVTTEPAEPTVPGIGRVLVEILHQPDPKKQNDADSAEVVRTVALLKADPARINLAEDFGFDEETVAELAGSMPIPGFDPNNLNMQELVAMDPLQLVAMLPTLMPIIQRILGAQGLQIDPNMSPDQLQQFLLGQLAGGAGGAAGGDGQFPPGMFPPGLEPGAAGDPSQIADMIRNAAIAAGAQPGAAPPRMPGGGNPDDMISDGAPDAGDGDAGNPGGAPPGGNPGGAGSPEAAAMAEMIRQRAIEAGAQPGPMPERRPFPGGGAQPGGMPRGGAGAGGMDTSAIEQMIRQRVADAQGGGQPGGPRGGAAGGGGPRGGSAGGTGGAPPAGPRGGAASPGATPPARPGGQQMTIEDLMRMRDQFRAGQGGGRR